MGLVIILFMATRRRFKEGGRRVTGINASGRGGKFSRRERKKRMSWRLENHCFFRLDNNQEKKKEGEKIVDATLRAEEKLQSREKKKR